MNQALTADQLRRRLVAQGHEVKRAHAAMFLGYWLEQGIVTETWPGRYALTDYGLVARRWSGAPDRGAEGRMSHLHPGLFKNLLATHPASSPSLSPGRE